MGVTSRKPPKEKATKPKAKAEGAVEGAWRYITDDDGNPSGKVRNSAKLPYENKLNEILAGVALGAEGLAGDQFASAAIRAKAPEIAYGWAKLAQTNPAVKRALDFLFTGSATAEAIVPTVSLVLMLGWHYGFFVPDKIGSAVCLANGMVPVSREVELEWMKRASETQQSENGNGSTDANDVD